MIVVRGIKLQIGFRIRSELLLGVFVERRERVQGWK